MKLAVIGGVAGGASTAARARRLDENMRIMLFERGDYISFANCGLPYHVGKVIGERESLLVMTPEKLKARTGIEARIRHEVKAIDPLRHILTIEELDSGRVYEETYDKLVVSTGSRPAVPTLPGVELPQVMRLWNIPDMDAIITRINAGARSAVVVGAGFIGLEIAENLRERGLEVSVVELMDQVLPTIDHEMSIPLRRELEKIGIKVMLSEQVSGFSELPGGRVETGLASGQSLSSDFVVMSVGVRPNSELAKAAGLEIGPRGGIVTDAHMRTSNPDIYAVGDVAQVLDPIYGGKTMIPLAGPANKQGRIAADNICGRSSEYHGTLGVSIVKIGSLSAAAVGWTERRLLGEKKEFHKVYLHPSSHASYYPGCAQLNMKVLVDRQGKLLGAQIVGEKGVDKRIDVIATAMKGGQGIHDLEELELAYAPPYGSAKDPVNFAGMIAGNILGGDSVPVYCESIPGDALLLDIREPAETELGVIEGAKLIPLGSLRERLGELPKDKLIVPYCRVGLRGYLAERILRQHGFKAGNLAGGLATWELYHPEKHLMGAATAGNCCAYAAPVQAQVTAGAGELREIDLRSMQCPGPVVRLKQELEQLPDGGGLRLRANAAFANDLQAWAAATGNRVASMEILGGELRAEVRKGQAAPAQSGDGSGSGLTIVLFSNDLDKAMAAFIIATGFASAGMKVDMFFTFWGLSVLRRDPAPPVSKDLLSTMFGWMLPRGARKLALSKMHMLGMGTVMMKHVMNKKHVSTLPELIATARNLGKIGRAHV